MQTTKPEAWADTVDLKRPNAARMYDYYLGGSHNFAIDREAANAVLAVAPEVAVAARANRSFLRRAVRYAMRQDIRQFLDLGSGVPTVGNVHEIVHSRQPTAPVVYVDNDPIAVAHTKALTNNDPYVGVIRADIRDIGAVLNDFVLCRLLDFTEPVTVLLVSILHFIPGDHTAMLRTLRTTMSTGSLLVISHASTVTPSGQTKAVQQLYRHTPTPVRLRSHKQIRAMLTGLDLVHPDRQPLSPADLVPVTKWRPDPDDMAAPAGADRSPFVAGLLAGVGRKPPGP